MLHPGPWEVYSARPVRSGHAKAELAHPLVGDARRARAPAWAQLLVADQVDRPGPPAPTPVPPPGVEHELDPPPARCHDLVIHVPALAPASRPGLDDHFVVR